ncbi:MAG: dethiobiotin synthase [Chthoniobacterales bacterium]|nr:dethiobiotin synthase [Chthoniobacterales bacterium]
MRSDNPNFFITATDTDAGKTYVTALLTKAMRKAGWKTVAIKPLASGGRGDSIALQAAGDDELTLDEITPVFYQASLGPLDAAPLEGEIFSIEQVLPTIQKLQKKYSSLLFEGVGGWLVPLSPGKMLPDLVRAIGSPIILVVRNRLGAMNHTLLTLESIAHRGFHCAGMILNHHPEDQEDPAIPGNRRFFQELSKKQHHSFFLEIHPHQQELLFPFS